ncbi:phosphate/phosphite/phosphonate ABC transporter substrate-binding protein [Burkholderia pseudomallei]|uniref:phosphate/phosphite/phosphonate ABC transporter substrate-binding protein n=1 Tax=Burkholderia pseudomallei TaxID=28450 RepID=UPI0009C579F3|nr:PhnD/SsuA/transferrin family substrate-binding protein [Burkholderia pseudomallei]MBD2943647.1 PhnD/SsuA/transferrin family substrate-binding protein [Burkholderia pseudomallei]MBD2953327.1 PhnD/SsuA/transferrin family substrate-binding protein [Burkholderia pseudomallei]MBD2987636.1 PhnD/SsuA/transferrin family substrate-binding protein [Burkholderia pseudomallei]MBD2995809.1 PhnD/SsuA/transferrin family substrate-binding protein [Burkholderia pseudomallei]MBF3569946.1 PhnD/SsuA/transferri
MTRWIAGLPMYNVTPRHAALWRSLLRDALHAFARAGGPANVTLLGEPSGEPDGELLPLWRRGDLLLSQTCGYPYRMLGVGDAVHLIATPVFDAAGCDGPRYCSMLAVSASAHARGATTLAACRGLRAACNGDDSHSGMNALRHAIAPHARGGRFFSAVTRTGSHLSALRALDAGAADLAAIDCVTLAYVRDALPAWLRRVRIIGATAAAPGLPFIASRALAGEHVGALRDALDAAVAIDAERARALRLCGFARLAPDAYAEIERFEREAVALGYPALA